jgi:hypothetical protein
MKSNQIISLIILFLISSISKAQPVVGFWKVEKVEIGDFELTPIAKWIKINLDSTYQSGNGWLQNMEGKWIFDSRIMTYLSVGFNGIKDEFGPFSVTYKDEAMIWKRAENGDSVVILLDRITKLPKLPADEITGLWELKEIIKNNLSKTGSFEAEEIKYIFLKWDRRYWSRKFNNKRTFGYWHINGHRPELTLIDDQKDKANEKWNILVKDRELKMIGISDSNKNSVRKYRSISEFPE